MSENKGRYDSYTYIIGRVCSKYIKNHLLDIFFALIFMVLLALCTAGRAYIIKPAIDKIFVNKDLVALYKIPFELMFLAIMSSIAMYMQGVIMNKINTKISIKLQKDLFDKLIREDIHFFKTKSVSTINALFGNISGITSIINTVLSGMFLQICTLFSLISVMLYQNWKMTIISFISFPTLLIPLRKIAKKMKHLMERNTERNINLSGDIGEAFENISIIKSSCSEEKEKDEIENKLKIVQKTQRSIVKKSLLVSPMSEMVGTIGFALVVLYGGICVINGTNTAGDFFVFITSLLSAYKPAKSFSNLGVDLQNAFVLSKRYFLLLDKENKIKEGSTTIEKVIGDIEFNHVDFNYPRENAEEEIGKQVIFDMNLNIKHNHSYALVGHSGSGKSTIFNLILRFYDVVNGEILLDGINVKDLTFKCLRRNISIVSQDVKLFNDTIYNNILYERSDATREEILEAAKLANVEEFVLKLENGYDTVIGPNGSLLSGGQKQRISIARAFLKNSPILLLDEATSALDPISEDLIKKSISKLMINKTTIIIAHRLSTIVNCDHIFTFENGKLIEEGSHEELLEKKGVYEDLYKKQFTVNKN